MTLRATTKSSRATCDTSQDTDVSISPRPNLTGPARFVSLRSHSPSMFNVQRSRCNLYQPSLHQLGTESPLLRGGGGRLCPYACPPNARGPTRQNGSKMREWIST